jgi:hypothetical protein
MPAAAVDTFIRSAATAFRQVVVAVDPTTDNVHTL